MLSRTSRSLRSIAQSVLFRSFRINLEKKLRGSIDDLLANPQICASIRSLEVFALRIMAETNEETLSHVKKLFPKMVRLRTVGIYNARLSKEFIDAFLETAANIPLRVFLYQNTYPSCLGAGPNTPLRISHLKLTSSATSTSLDFYRLVLRASATTLTELIVRDPANELMELADIDLPFLHSLILPVGPRTEGSRTEVAAFITAKRTIRKFELHSSASLPYLPPSVLPALRELIAPIKVVNKLVPGRPVEVIEVNDLYRPSGQDWIVEDFARSTARVQTLRIHHFELFPWMVRQIGAILPSLETLWLCVADNVRGLFAPCLDSFSFRYSLRSSKFSLHSSASCTYALV